MGDETEKKRGILLTGWLILVLIVNAAFALIYIVDPSYITYITDVFPPIPTGMIYLLGVCALLNVVFAIFLFMWKKWAFFASVGMAVIVFVINAGLIGVGIFSPLGLLGPVILYLVMRPKWELFK